MSSSTSSNAAKDGGVSSLRALIVQHKLVALGVAALVVFMLASVVLPLFGGTAGAVSDSTTCTQWGSANQIQQAAYGKLYLKEHGPLKDGGRSPAAIITAINNGCDQAYGNDVDDTTSVVQAISGNF